MNIKKLLFALATLAITSQSNAVGYEGFSESFDSNHYIFCAVNNPDDYNPTVYFRMFKDSENVSFEITKKQYEDILKRQTKEQQKNIENFISTLPYAEYLIIPDIQIDHSQLKTKVNNIKRYFDNYWKTCAELCSEYKLFYRKGSQEQLTQQIHAQINEASQQLNKTINSLFAGFGNSILMPNEVPAGIYLDPNQSPDVPAGVIQQNIVSDHFSPKRTSPSFFSIKRCLGILGLGIVGIALYKFFNDTTTIQPTTFGNYFFKNFREMF